MNPERLAILRGLPYAAYLQTVEWRRRRDIALARASWRCEMSDCRETHGLEVHHRTYEHLGEERDEDLRVLCPSHHHRRHAHLETLRRLHWRVIRDVINSGPFDSFAEFVGAVKDRLAREHIIVDWRDLNEMLAVALRDVSLEVPVIGVHRELRKDDAPCISEDDAKQILGNLGLQRFIQPMPTAVVVDHFEAAYEEARERAYEMGIELTREEFFR